MMDFDRFDWLSFDCYGTLVDWETGISDAIASALAPHDVHMSRADILALFADVEPQIQDGGKYLEYRRVLRRTMAMIGIELGIQFDQEQLGILLHTLPEWPIFPDTVESLRTMQTRYRLAIISNTDDDLFAQTAQKLGVEFDAVITAQQVRRYKPDTLVFDNALSRMGCEKGAWLHIGESLYHDIGPANALGIASVWVNRAESGGGTRRTDAVPDLEVGSLAALADMMMAR